MGGLSVWHDTKLYHSFGFTHNALAIRSGGGRGRDEWIGLPPHCFRNESKEFAHSLSVSILLCEVLQMWFKWLVRLDNHPKSHLIWWTFVEHPWVQDESSNVWNHFTWFYRKRKDRDFDVKILSTQIQIFWHKFDIQQDKWSFNAGTQD